MKKLLMLAIFLLASCTDTPTPVTPQSVTVPEPPVNKIATPLGTYSTKLTDKTPGRLHNIKLAASILDNTKIKAGETFSFNDTVGPRTEKEGYKEAIIFDGHGNKTKGYGGGVCQITSTLYNAALAAGLKIEERHEHSRDVPYIADGKDATVSYYDGEDLKFENTAQRDLTVKINIGEDSLTASIE